MNDRKKFKVPCAATAEGTTAAPARHGQVLMGVMHGGHIIESKQTAATGPLSRQAGVTSLAEAVASAPGIGEGPQGGTGAPKQVDEVTFETPFDYLLAELADNPIAHLPSGDAATNTAVVAALKALGAAMAEPVPPSAAGNSNIPAVYTYWGQFIDHDLTANTDRNTTISDITKADLAPLTAQAVRDGLKNLRQPTANLDSLYGDGPTWDPAHPTQAGRMYDGAKLRLGAITRNPAIPGDDIPGPDDAVDLPRIGPLIDAGVLEAANFDPAFAAKPNFRQLAFIADARNDENLVVAQFHLAVMRFHNAMVDWVQSNAQPCLSPQESFEKAQQLTRWHYQWLSVNDYLKTVCLAGVVDQVLLGGPRFYEPRGEGPYMPLEFSVGAFRFGHTMVRGGYDHNRNFGAESVVSPFASLDQLFLFTGNGSQRGPDGKISLNPFLGLPTLPSNWPIEWKRFTDKGSDDPTHFARRIDTQLAPPLLSLINQGNDGAPGIGALLKHLAQRNLLRGYLLGLPTGQAVATAMGVTPLSEAELTQNASPQLAHALGRQGFLQNTPLWYYILKEAEVRANGNSLGELGSLIVCETIIGQLRNDPESYLGPQAGGWHPGLGARLPNGRLIVTIQDFFEFAGLTA